jgi:hypothetical protein
VSLWSAVHGRAGQAEAQETQTQPSGDGQSGARPDDAAEASSAAGADNLAHGSYADRQRATLEMWRRRSRSRQAVQDAARHADPEVAERAEWILRQWRSGALPGVGNEASQLWLDRDGPSALATVLEQGAFDAVRVAVEESAGTIEYDQIKRRVARSLRERFPIFIERAVSDGSEPDLLNLLDAVAIDRNFATASRDLMKVLQIEPDDLNQLPSAAATWSRSDQDLCRAQLAMLRGDVDQSIRFAREANDPILLRITQMLGDRWQAIADDSFAAAESATTAEDRIESYAWGLAASSRVRDRQRIDQATKRLLESQADENEALTALRWRSLAVHDDVRGAIDVIAKSDRATAAEIACASSRFGLAAELCGFEIERINDDLDDWIMAAYAEQAELPSGSLAPSMERLYALARLLVNVGDQDNAWRIYRRLTPREIIVSPYGTTLRERTLSEIELLNRLDWMLELAVAEGDNAVAPQTRRIIGVALNTDFQAFQTVLEQIKVIRPGTDYRQRFQMTFQLFRGKLPDSFDADKDFHRLFNALVHHRQIERSGGRVVPVERVILDLDIIEMFLRHRQVGLAREGIELLARRGDLDAMISLAESEMEQGESQKSAEQWRRIAAEAEKFTAAEMNPLQDDGLAYGKSVVGQWVLAKRAGHHEIADQLKLKISMMLASPSLNFRMGLADHLRQLQQYKFAVEVLRELIVLVSFGGTEAPDFFKVAVTYVGALDDLKESDPKAFEELQIDPRDSVKWSDLAVLGILKTTIYRDTAFISVPLSVRKTFLQFAIETGDDALAEEAIRQIESYDVLDIDYGERMLPQLRKSGMSAMADSAFDRLIDRGTEHLRRFGTDAKALNNLAWTAAMNQRSLEHALDLSTLAVMLEPDSVVYRDTLAEVLHLHGRTDEALAIESACLLDEPDDWHLHEQIKKYQQLIE